MERWDGTGTQPNIPCRFRCRLGRYRCDPLVAPVPCGEGVGYVPCICDSRNVRFPLLLSALSVLGGPVAICALPPRHQRYTLRHRRASLRRFPLFTPASHTTTTTFVSFIPPLHSQLSHRLRWQSLPIVLSSRRAASYRVLDLHTSSLSFILATSSHNKPQTDITLTVTTLPKDF